MQTGKNIFLNKIPAKVTLICIGFILIFFSCRKATNAEKLSSKSCYVLPSSLDINGYFVCDGEPGFFVSSNETINDSAGNVYSSQSKLTRIELNTATGNFSESELAFDPPLPKFTTRVNTMHQLMPNSNSFILNSKYTYYGSGSDTLIYTKLYLTDKTLSSPKKILLPDSAVSINSVAQMPDGKLALSSTKGTTKRIICVYKSLLGGWSSGAESTSPSSKDFSNGQILATSQYIYLLQPSRYFTRSYRIMKWANTGPFSSFYFYLGLQQQIHAAGQLIESPDGYYIIGTEYISAKSDYDIHVSTMGASNTLLAGHVWNLPGYLPDWNTATRNVFNTYFSGSSSQVIKTAKGYAYTLAYPDSKDQWSLALVLLNNELQIESVKVLAKNVGNGFDDPAHENLSLLNDENRLYIIWKQNRNNYFYVLDNEGNLIP
jgi:hypothetical protein